MKSVRKQESGRSTESYGVHKGLKSRRISDTITSFVNNIDEFNKICEVVMRFYTADTHLNVYIYSKRRLVFLEKRSERTEFRFCNLCKCQRLNSHPQLPSADYSSPEKINQTAQLPKATPK